jgi:hypothetical protein
MRRVPDDSTLARIDPLRFDLSDPRGSRRALADDLLAGRYRSRDRETVAVGLEPTYANMEIGSPSAQLDVSSLIVADTLLAAYRETGSDRYFNAALQSALAWARFERSAWIPIGFLWNDHAIAARVQVLTSLWREYRTRNDFNTDRGAELLAFVARSAELLARPSHYTVRTNHGIMQDLALLHVGIAFPRLPGTAERTRIALDRLALHLPFYVSPDGVVLEHSTGYQEMAVFLLHDALEYFKVLGIAAPPGLRERYEAAECLQRHLTRPDLSLPSYGDTRTMIRPEWLIARNAPVLCGAQPESRVDLDFGLASLRGFGAAGTQLFMTWADFASGAHKHDDELATWLWIDGQDWWLGSGYWPYGDAGRSIAISWRGANAPHAVGEMRPGRGGSRLLSSLQNGPVQMLDVERREPDGRVYRRQVLGLGDLGVLTLDSASGASADTRFESVWTLVPGIAVQPMQMAPGAYQLSDARSGRLLAVSFAGVGQEVQQLSGSRDPFGGLVIRDGLIQKAQAFVVSVPFGNWSAALWAPVAAASPGAVTMAAWDGPERWSMSLSGPGGVHAITRNDSGLELASPREGGGSWRLDAAADARPLLDQATAAYREAALRYPPFPDYVEYRMRVSLGIAVLFVAQYVGLWMLGLLGMTRPLRAAFVTLAWAGTTWWLYYSYLV